MGTATTRGHRRPHAGPLRYALVWAALAALTVTTFLVARVDLGAFHLPAALLIATGKSTLVVLFFMHLWEHPATSRLVLAVALIFVALMIALTVSDVGLRFPLANPPGSEGALQFQPPG